VGAIFPVVTAWQCGSLELKSRSVDDKSITIAAMLLRHKVVFDAPLMQSVHQREWMVSGASEFCSGSVCTANTKTVML